MALRNVHVHQRVLWSAVGALCAAFAMAQRAEAHVTPEPSFVEADARTTVAFETPNERAPHATTSLVIEAPDGVELSAADAPEGWRLELAGGRARWTGGRIGGTRAVAFPIFVTARTRAGTVTFRAIQGYDDGESVRWGANLTVLPASGSEAPSQRFDRALAAGAVGLVVIAGSFLVLRLIRRRPLQDP
jgi:Domain of unkown function (DUF1775)